MIWMLVHGYNDPSAGEKNIDKCEPYLIEAGDTVDTDEADYGFFNFWAVRFFKRSVVLRIAKAVNNYPSEEEIVIMCYSNGANYVRKALPHFRRRVKIVFCSAAVNRKAKFHTNMYAGWNFHIKNDIPLWLASFIPWDSWGRMGAVGYKGDDTRISNENYSDIASGHGGMFKDSVIGFFVGQARRLVRGGEV